VYLWLLVASPWFIASTRWDGSLDLWTGCPKYQASYCYILNMVCCSCLSRTECGDTFVSSF
jgi:hypothetical protein